MLKKLKLLKKPLFQKRRWQRFPAKKNAGCPKAPRDFPPRKDGILYPRRVVLGLPSLSHRVCADGRTYGCTDVRTDGHVTITSQPKFLGLIGYQISLVMELRWWALPAGSALTGTSFSVVFLQSHDVKFHFNSTIKVCVKNLLRGDSTFNEKY